MANMEEGQALHGGKSNGPGLQSGPTPAIAPEKAQELQRLAREAGDVDAAKRYGALARFDRAERKQEQLAKIRNAEDETFGKLGEAAAQSTSTIKRTSRDLQEADIEVREPLQAMRQQHGARGDTKTIPQISPRQLVEGWAALAAIFTCFQIIGMEAVKQCYDKDETGFQESERRGTEAAKPFQEMLHDLRGIREQLGHVTGRKRQANTESQGAKVVPAAQPATSPAKPAHDIGARVAADEARSFEALKAAGGNAIDIDDVCVAHPVRVMGAPLQSTHCDFNKWCIAYSHLGLPARAEAKGAKNRRAKLCPWQQLGSLADAADGSSQEASRAVASCVVEEFAARARGASELGGLRKQVRPNALNEAEGWELEQPASAGHEILHGQSSYDLEETVEKRSMDFNGLAKGNPAELEAMTVAQLNELPANRSLEEIPHQGEGASVAMAAIARPPFSRSEENGKGRADDVRSRAIEFSAALNEGPTDLDHELSHWSRPMSAITVALLDLQRTPRKPLHWAGPEGNDELLKRGQLQSIGRAFEEFDQPNASTAVVNSVGASLWQQASAFDNGAGLAQAADARMSKARMSKVLLAFPDARRRCKAEATSSADAPETPNVSTCTSRTACAGASAVALARSGLRLPLADALQRLQGVPLRRRREGARPPDGEVVGDAVAGPRDSCKAPARCSQAHPGGDRLALLPTGMLWRSQVPCDVYVSSPGGGAEARLAPLREAGRLHLSWEAVDTVTNFTTLYAALVAASVSEVLLVTSPYHMPRARALAEDALGPAGIAVSPRPVPGGLEEPVEPRWKTWRDRLRLLLWRSTGLDLLPLARAARRWGALRLALLAGAAAAAAALLAHAAARAAVRWALPRAGRLRKWAAGARGRAAPSHCPSSEFKAAETEIESYKVELRTTMQKANPQDVPLQELNPDSLAAAPQEVQQVVALSVFVQYEELLAKQTKAFDWVVKCAP
ncbi:unnamed protein product [Prorocentrum cordatum]|uniref:DUF218 domain-containing protein n=1 Tax=Prorocentrum cordatum TaxID=2364126 RepID=A0ABN9VZ13_9DINO|nr:unnamed protein product [Polarella glacialis]